MRDLRGLFTHLFTAVLLAWIAAAPLTVHAWGAEGHRIVCAIAEDRLDDRGRSFLASVMAESAELDGEINSKWAASFAEACVWADDAKFDGYRGSYEQHFVNVPKAADSLQVSRDCPALNCLLTAIQRNLTHLSVEPSGRRERARRVAALRFLGHFVGDLHQPLHVSHAEDWGGNRIRVKFFGKDSNLHRIWDLDAPKRMGLSHRNPPGPRDVAMSGVLTWADQSLALARHSAYRVGDREIGIGDAVGKTYQRQIEPIIEQRLVEAGVRLAWLINQAAAGQPVRFLKAAND